MMVRPTTLLLAALLVLLGTSQTSATASDERKVAGRERRRVRTKDQQSSEASQVEPTKNKGRSVDHKKRVELRGGNAASSVAGIKKKATAGRGGTKEEGGVEQVDERSEDDQTAESNGADEDSEEEKDTDEEKEGASETEKSNVKVAGDAIKEEEDKEELVESNEEDGDDSAQEDEDTAEDEPSSIGTNGDSEDEPSNIGTENDEEDTADDEPSSIANDDSEDDEPSNDSDIEVLKPTTVARSEAAAGDSKSSANDVLKISSPQITTLPKSSAVINEKDTKGRGGPLSRLMGIFGVSDKPVQSPSATKRRGILGRLKKRKPTSEEMLYSDVTLAFVNGLKSGLYDDLDEPLSKERKQRLLDWLDLLSATLPQEFGLHRIIDLLRSNWVYISSSRSNLMSILSRSLPAAKEYSADCTKISRRVFGAGRKAKTPARGSTCALWRLFHVMSVGLVERMGGTDVSKNDDVLADVDAALGVAGGKYRQRYRTFSPKEAAEVIRDVVDSFFTCEVCRQNFIEQYDRCDYGRCERLKDAKDKSLISDYEWREFPLYLWEYHNGVSTSVARKLAGDSEASETKATVSQIWPSIDECLTCQKEDGSWNKPKVYDYLRDSYWGDGSAAETAIIPQERGGLNLHAISALYLVALLGIVILILSIIKLWSSGFTRQHNLVAYIPPPARFVGKRSGKNE